jgi:hypothetical protein
MDTLIPYFLRLLPGLIPFALLLALVPRKFAEMRLFAYILLFILLRDTMTPMGLWKFSNSIDLRFTAAPPVLILLGFASVAAVVGLQRMEPELGKLLVWVKGKTREAALLGALGTLAIVLPVFVFHKAAASEFGTEPVTLTSLISIAILAFLGNLLEEVLFRGYLQGLFEKKGLSVFRSAIATGIAFGACHAFLAISVTDLGLPILAFTCYEGLVASWIRMRSGVLASTLAHGGAIFLMANGFV